METRKKSCIFYMKGNCKFGAKCKFSHDDISKSTASSTRSGRGDEFPSNRDRTNNWSTRNNNTAERISSTGNIWIIFLKKKEEIDDQLRMRMFVCQAYQQDSNKLLNDLGIIHLIPFYQLNYKF
jgi:hypothetical protein